MSKVRNDLFNVEDIVVDDLVEIEVDSDLVEISECYSNMLRMKDSRYATCLLLDYLVYERDLINLNHIKDWLKAQ